MMSLADLGIQHLALFAISGWLLNLTPGPDVFYILTHGMRGGWRAGVVAALGITAGCFVHIFAAAVGVSALITASATAFMVLKWLGAAYLVWVGVQMLRSPAPTNATNSIATSAGADCANAPKSMQKVFLQGFWTNALNPKVALFFLAFLPQFITPGSAHPTLAFALLGLLFNLNSLPINLGYAVLAGWASRRMGTVRRGMHWLERGAGALFVAFGLKLALSSTPNS